LRAHWIGTGRKRQMAIPWVMLHKAFCQAAQDFKYKGRKNMSPLIGSTVACEQAMIPLDNSDYEVFTEWVRIPPRTGAMVQIGRPLKPKWKCSFVLVCDCEMWNAELLEQIIVGAGKTIGIGAWRPALKGPYGRFVVTSFEVVG
jgi:hypothetical protein